MQQLSSAQKQVIQIAIAALLLIGCIAVLMPFTGTLLLATVICVTTAPAHKFILTKCRGRNNLAAALMCLLMVLLLVVPMAVLSGSLASGVEMAIAYVRPLLESGLPMHVPKWVSNLPIAGSMIEDYWHALLASREELNELLRQFIAPTTGTIEKKKVAKVSIAMPGTPAMRKPIMATIDCAAAVPTMPTNTPVTVPSASLSMRSPRPPASLRAPVRSASA